MKSFLFARTLLFSLFLTMRVWSQESAYSPAMEISRQDMIAAQLGDLISRFDELKKDVDSNRGVAVEVVKITSDVRDRLDKIRGTRLQPARSLLEQAAREPRPNDPRIVKAQESISLAAREIGSLLIQAGVSQATEVFSTEVQDIIRIQQSLPPRGPAAPQVVLTERTTTLVNELRAIRDTSADALAAIRLSRARKIVETGGVIDAMREAAKAMEGGGTDAAPRQLAAIKKLRETLLTLRPDRRLTDLIRVRTMLQEVAKSHQALRDTILKLPADQFSTRRSTLALQQETILRPLSDLDNEVLDLGGTLPSARDKGVEVVKALKDGQTKAAAEGQEFISQCFGELLFTLGKEIAKLSVLGATHQRMLEATARVQALSSFRDRAEQNRSSGYDLTLANKSLAPVVMAEEQLVAGIEKFMGQLDKDNRFASSLRRPLTKTVQSLRQSVPSMQTNKFETALVSLAAADGFLKEGLDIAKRELSMVEKLWMYRQTTADIQLINRSLNELIAETADLKADLTRAQLEKRNIKEFTPTQDVLARALAQLQEQTGAIREANEMRQVQTVAAAAMAKAQKKIEANEPAAALAAIEEVQAALMLSQRSGNAVVTQIEMLLIEMEVSTELSGKALDLWQRQVTLRETTEETPESEFARLQGEQDLLLSETDVLSKLSAVPGAATAFGQAATEMKLAITQLQAKNQAQTVVHQKKAEEQLLIGLKELDAFLKMMLAMLAKEDAGGSTIIKNYTPMFQVMTAILVLATEQGELREVVVRTPESLLRHHILKQEEFRGERMDEIYALRPTGLVKPHLLKSQEFMAAALTALNAKTKDAAVKQQQLTEKELRIAYAKMVVELVSKLQPPKPPSDAPPKPVWQEKDAKDSFMFDSKGGWKEFSKSAPGGKRPKGTKGEWESLVNRERAPLDEKFARELPLEYRKLLKDYYEALSK